MEQDIVWPELDVYRHQTLWLSTVAPVMVVQEPATNICSIHREQKKDHKILQNVVIQKTVSEKVCAQNKKNLKLKNMK